jgi:hypothetical protein
MQLDLLNKPSGRTAMLMASGFTLQLDAPCAEGMPITDIARALAYQPRWAGATRLFYSVAEHSVLVSRLVPPHCAFDGLMHDCEEAIIGDVPSCVKTLLGRDYLNSKLGPVKLALSSWFGFRLDEPNVKHADLVSMATELRDLLPPAWMDWGHLPPPDDQKIVPVGPEKAYTLFLERYMELKHLCRPSEVRLSRSAGTLRSRKPRAR